MDSLPVATLSELPEHKRKLIHLIASDENYCVRIECERCSLPVAHVCLLTGKNISDITVDIMSDVNKTARQLIRESI